MTRERPQHSIRAAGEAMFKLLIARAGCEHRDPRHPIHRDCPWCVERAAALDAWDEALATEHMDAWATTHSPMEDMR